MVKILAIFFSILFIQLSIMPCCLKNSDNYEVLEDKCCQNTNNIDNETANNNHCSPFFGCCSIAGFIVKPFFTPKFIKETVQEKLVIFTSSNYTLISNVFVFQPPRLV